MKQKVAIVGAGKVGSVFAYVLAKKGYQLVGIASRSLESANNLANVFGIPASLCASDITKAADIVFITTPDRCIASVVEKIAQDGGFKAGQVVLHAAGSLGSKVLAAAKEGGAFIGCIHPLQSFADIESMIDKLTGTYFAIDGDEQALIVIKQVINDFGGLSFKVPSSERPLYHAAACIASNYLVALMHWATEVFGRFGLTSTEATTALLPLIQGTLKNLEEQGSIAALTGPISRGDSSTISTHLKAFTGDKDRQLYAELGLYTLDIAVQKGSIDAQQALKIKQLLYYEADSKRSN